MYGVEQIKIFVMTRKETIYNELLLFIQTENKMIVKEKNIYKRKILNVKMSNDQSKKNSRYTVC
jgi:hypothetical protein